MLKATAANNILKIMMSGRRGTPPGRNFSQSCLPRPHSLFVWDLGNVRGYNGANTTILKATHNHGGRGGCSNVNQLRDEVTTPGAHAGRGHTVWCWEDHSTWM